MEEMAGLFYDPRSSSGAAQVEGESVGFGRVRAELEHRGGPWGEMAEGGREVKEGGGKTGKTR